MRTFDLLDKASPTGNGDKGYSDGSEETRIDRETTGCLSSFFGYVSLVVGAVLFNFIGYFIVLVILTLCGVFSFGEAVFLLLVGIVLAFLFWPLVASFALLNFLD